MQCNRTSLGGCPSTYYADDAVALMRKYTGTHSGMFIAKDGPSALGCVGHLNGREFSEITKLFVRADARGKGVGRLLLSTALDAIQLAGSGPARLATISFMTDAIALYRSFGFIDCDPIEPAPKGLEEATRYMERVVEAS
jgi:GNAT superfamily N-acetyltransferase